MFIDGAAVRAAVAGTAADDTHFDQSVIDSLELLRIFNRLTDPTKRQAIIHLLDYMIGDGDPATCSDDDTGLAPEC